MYTQNLSLQPINNPAPQNANHDFVARTMSSREIAELVEARHNDVVATIERLFAKNLLRSSRKSRREATGGRPVDVYDLIERDTHLVVAGYSDEHRARVIDRWQELEAKVAPQAPADLSKLEILQMALESEKARVLLTVQVEAQAKKIDHLENLFKEGMSPTQFCKGLNGVNVMQVGHFLERRNWLYNESKSGTRYRVAAYARDKYMTEHQHEVAPHGKDPFISYTPRAAHEEELGRPAHPRQGRAGCSMTYDEMREEVAEAIWDVRRDHEDRCDQELEDLGKDHPVWEEADSVITTLAGLGLLVLS